MGLSFVFVFCVLCLCFVFVFCVCVLCFVFSKKHKDRYGMSNNRLAKECVWCDHKINKNTKYEQKQEKHKYSKKINKDCKSYQLNMNLDP